MVKAEKLPLASFALMASLGLAGCETGTTSGAVYYDSMLWNDYYRGYYRPGYPVRPDPPERPEKPVNPIEPPPVARPPGSIDPGFSRPVRPNPPIHRPAQVARPPIRR